MLSSISGQNDPWAQLAALRAAQSTSQSSQSSGSAATAATPFSAGSSVNGTAGGAITGGAFPTLSSGLLSQLLSFGSMSGNGASGASASAGSAGVGFPSTPPAVPSTALPDGETGTGNLISNLFASLQSMISNIGGSLAPASSTAAAGTTATDSTTNSAATGSSGTISTSGLSSGLLQDLQSIAADFGGSGTASAGSPTDTTASNGPIGLPVGGPMFLPWNGGAAAGDAASSVSSTSSSSATGSTSTTASVQGANNALMQQISQALAAYMQSIAGGSSTIGASLTGVSA